MLRKQNMREKRQCGMLLTNVVMKNLQCDVGRLLKMGSFNLIKMFLVNLE